MRKIDLERINRAKVFPGNKRKGTNSNGSLRSRKICRNPMIKFSSAEIDSENYNLIMNFNLLKGFVMDFLCCSECNSDNVDLMDNLSLRMGYAHKLKLLCLDCLYEKER